MTDLSASELTAHYANIRRKFRGLRPPAKVIPINVEAFPEAKPVEVRYPAPNVVYLSSPVWRPYVVFGTYPTIRHITNTVAKFYNVTVLDLTSDRRPAGLVLARHVAMYLARHLTARSFPYIGRMMGGRDHTTVLFAANKIAKLIETDARLRDEIDILKMKISDGMRGVQS